MNYATNMLGAAAEYTTPAPKHASVRIYNPLILATLFSLFAHFANAQNSELLKDKDLEKQFKAVMKDYKDDATVEKAAAKYKMSKGDVIDQLEEPTKYVVQTLFPNIFVDHMQFKKKLINGLNKNNAIEYILLKEAKLVQSNANEIANNTITFETTAKISDLVSYPIEALDDHNIYMEDKIIKSQVQVIKTAFLNAMAKAETLLSAGYASIDYPSKEIFDNRKQNFPQELLDPKYMTEDASRTDKYTVKFDLNKEIGNELQSNAFVDKDAYIKAIIQEIMFMATLKALNDQYQILITEYAKDATKQNTGAGSK